MQEGAKRNVTIDILRCILVVCALIKHTSEIETVTDLIVQSIISVCPGIFIMLSGYCMLSKRREERYIVSKVTNMVIHLLIWSTVYTVLRIGVDTQHFTLWIYNIITESIANPSHLWFIYALIPLYLITPILQVFIENADRQQYRYALICTFLLGTVVTMLVRHEGFGILEQILSSAKIPWQFGTLFMYLFGGYIYRFQIEIKSFAVPCILGILSALVSITLGYVDTEMYPDFWFSSFSPFIMVECIVIVLCVVNNSGLESHITGGYRHAICWIAEGTGGLYYNHMLILELICIFMPKIYSIRLLSIPLTYVCGLMFSKLCAKVPILSILV